MIYRFDQANLERLAAALRDLGAESVRYPGLETDDLPALLSGSDLWRWRTRYGIFDMMTWASGAPRDYGELRRDADVYDVGGHQVRVASLDHLIAMKRTTGRPQDQSKLLELEDLKRLREELRRQEGGLRPEA